MPSEKGKPKGTPGNQPRRRVTRYGEANEINVTDEIARRKGFKIIQPDDPVYLDRYTNVLVHLGGYSADVTPDDPPRHETGSVHMHLIDRGIVNYVVAISAGGPAGYFQHPESTLTTIPAFAGIENVVVTCAICDMKVTVKPTDVPSFGA